MVRVLGRGQGALALRPGAAPSWRAPEDGSHADVLILPRTVLAVQLLDFPGLATG